MMEACCKVCVTGASGNIASLLINKLLAKGYTVHATLRNLKDESKVGLLKSFPQSQHKLVLFEADIYNSVDFEPAIKGCQFVFHVATPLIHQPGSQFKDITEASLAGSKSIAMYCKRAGTVKRLIYTGSVLSASPMKDGGTGFKDVMDETCWTPLNDSLAYLYHDAYVKTVTEKYMLSCGNNENGGGLEVVTLLCGVVGGDTLQPFTPGSVGICISQITGNANGCKSLEFVQKFLGKIPLVHVDDVCEAHIFCMESTSSINGRFLCASSYVSLKEIANHYVLHHSEFTVNQKYADVPKKDMKWGSTKLCDKGFVYKYDTKMILDDCIKCARRMGDL
ncbi:putative anthocyanidin reductase [Trifolium repens]|nr:putative anthocyanidin reductase [Trifolium repens]